MHDEASRALVREAYFSVRRVSRGEGQRSQARKAPGLTAEASFDARQGVPSTGTRGVLLYVECRGVKGNEAWRERRPAAAYQRVPTLSMFEFTDQFGEAVLPLE
jgi:hypothetical protein